MYTLGMVKSHGPLGSPSARGFMNYWACELRFSTQAKPFARSLPILNNPAQIHPSARGRAIRLALRDANGSSSSLGSPHDPATHCAASRVVCMRVRIRVCAWRHDSKRKTPWFQYQDIKLGVCATRIARLRVQHHNHSKPRTAKLAYPSCPAWGTAG